MKQNQKPSIPKPKQPKPTKRITKKQNTKHHVLRFTPFLDPQAVAMEVPSAPPRPHVESSERPSRATERKKPLDDSFVIILYAVRFVVFFCKKSSNIQTFSWETCAPRKPFPTPSWASGRPSHRSHSAGSLSFARSQARPTRPTGHPHGPHACHSGTHTVREPGSEQSYFSRHEHSYIDWFTKKNPWRSKWSCKISVDGAFAAFGSV